MLGPAPAVGITTGALAPAAAAIVGIVVLLIGTADDGGAAGVPAAPGCVAGWAIVV
jgi:hypothetical protein